MERWTPRRRGRFALAGACATAGAVWLGAAGSLGDSGAVTLTDVPGDAFEAAGVRVSARADVPAGAISEAAARSRASGPLGGTAVRDAALVDCGSRDALAELGLQRPCWAVALSGEDVSMSGPVGSPPVDGSYRVVFLDALTGEFLVAIEG